MPYTNVERAVHADLREHGESRLKRAHVNSERLATEFVFKTLEKRLFSSTTEFLATLGHT